MPKKHFLIAAICTCVLLMVQPLFNLLNHPYAPQILGEVIWCVETDEKVLALTIDDGPSDVYTPRILELLDQYQARATFFVVGMNIAEHADLLVDIYTSGHEIGNHSWDHPRMSFRSAAFIWQQIQQTDSAILATGYQGDIPFRAPYGAKLLMLPYVLDQLERPNVLWSVDSKAWEEPAALSTGLDLDLSSGDIILFHISDKEHALDWMEMILEAYTARGYRFVTISELRDYQQDDLPSSFQCVRDGLLSDLFSSPKEAF